MLNKSILSAVLIALFATTTSAALAASNNPAAKFLTNLPCDTPAGKR